MFAIEPIYKSTMNGNYVINIGRQLGSGGKEIGEKLAARLGIDFYDKELINLASEESGLCREFFEKADEKASQGIIGGLFGMRFPFISDGAMPCTNCLSNDALFKIQSDVIRHLAANKSCVFVGRCADYILREHPRCANIFISASQEDRIARLCRIHGISEEADLLLIREYAFPRIRSVQNIIITIAIKPGEQLRPIIFASILRYWELMKR